MRSITISVGGSDNGAITVTQPPIDSVWDRHGPNSTLDMTRYIVPTSFSNYAVTLVYGDAQSPPVVWRSGDISASDIQTPSIAAVPVTYNGTALAAQHHAAVAAGKADPLHWARWPLADAGRGGGYVYFRHFKFGYTFSSDRFLVARLHEELCGWSDNTFEPDTPNNDPDSLFGWVNPKANLSGQGKDHLRTAWAGITLDASDSLTHEMGHVYGLGHSEITLEGVGWDPLRLQRLGHLFDPVKPHTMRSVMYDVHVGHHMWASLPLYRTVADRGEAYSKPMQRCPRTLVDVALPLQPFYHIVAVIPESGGGMGKLLPTRLEEMQLSIPAPQPGDVVIQLRDDMGNVLYSTGVWRETSDTTYISALVPDVPNMHTIDLSVDGALHDRLTRSPSVPVVTIEKPLPGHVVTSTLTVEWSASDGDGDDLVALVDYSRDGGASWIPVGSDAASSSLVLSSSGLAATNSGAIRVTVSDGVNSATAIVSNIVQPNNHAPELALIAPANGDTFKEDAEIVFVADAFDMEDGKLDGSSLTWVVLGNGTTLTGSGKVFSMLEAYPMGWTGAHLTPGHYEVTVTATDSDGVSVSKSVQFEVVAR